MRIEQLIADAEREQAQVPASALRTLIDTRLQTLRASQALILHRGAAEGARVDLGSLYSAPSAEAVAQATANLARIIHGGGDQLCAACA
jgi:hypothetical protein